MGKRKPENLPEPEQNLTGSRTESWPTQEELEQEARELAEKNILPPRLGPKAERFYAMQMEEGKKAKRRLARLLKKASSNSDEIQLQQELIAQGERARLKLFKSCEKLAAFKAREFVAQHPKNVVASEEDLIQEANAVLTKAVDKFNYRINARLSTYASKCIENYFKRILPSKFGRPNPKDLGKVSSAIKEIFQETGRAGNRITVEEISQRTRLSEKRVSELLRVLRKDVSLDEPLRGGKSRRKLRYETLADSKSFDPERTLLADSLMEIVEKELKNDPHAPEIIKLRYGLDGKGPRTLKEVAKILKLSRERVRQIEARAKKRLRRYLEGEK